MRSPSDRPSLQPHPQHGQAGPPPLDPARLLLWVPLLAAVIGLAILLGLHQAALPYLGLLIFVVAYNGLTLFSPLSVRVTLLDGKAHPVDSSDMAFQAAAGQAVRDAANESTVSMLEPIDAVDIEVANESVGSVLADLPGRRGQVHGTEPAPHPGRTMIHAEIPAQELSRYPIDLRSLSHGTGTFTRRFARYDHLPPQLAQDVLDACSGPEGEVVRWQCGDQPGDRATGRGCVVPATGTGRSTRRWRSPSCAG